VIKVIQFKDSEMVKYICTNCNSEFIPKVDFPKQCPRCGISYVGVKEKHGFRVSNAIENPIDKSVGLAPKTKNYQKVHSDNEEVIKFSEPKILRYKCSVCGYVWTPLIELPSKCPSCNNDFRDDNNSFYYVSDEYGNFEEVDEVSERVC
jgi:rubrerythrin